jgi:hypothetical protein
MLRAARARVERQAWHRKKRWLRRLEAPAVAAQQAASAKPFQARTGCRINA